MANLRIMLFAGAKAAVGTDHLAIELQLPTSICTLKTAIASQYPALEHIIKFSRLAVGCEFVEDQYVIVDDNLQHDIALIPPVSGG
ncbi:MAG: MoaD/ThiS family protein [Pirellula sp.]